MDEKTKETLIDLAVKERWQKESDFFICFIYFKGHFSLLAAIELLFEIAVNDFPTLRSMDTDLFVTLDKRFGIAFRVMGMEIPSEYEEVIPPPTHDSFLIAPATLDISYL